MQYDIRITGDPVVFDGENFVSGEKSSLKDVSWIYFYNNVSLWC